MSRIITEPAPDPDVEQALVDLLELAQEIRQRSAALAKLDRFSPNHRHETAHVAELVSRIEVRADRLGMSCDALLVLLNDRLNAKARRGQGAPARPTIRTLMDTLAVAVAAEHDAQRALTQAKQALWAAQRDRAAAEEALRVYGKAPLSGAVA